MKKCENFMFCKPAGVVLTGSYWVRASSQHMDIDTQVPAMDQITKKTLVFNRV
jgi:hypothetical protein